MRIREKAFDVVFDIFIYLVMAFTLVITLYPFLNVLAISLNESVDAMRGGIHIIPRKFTLDNYREIFKYSNPDPCFPHICPEDRHRDAAVDGQHLYACLCAEQEGIYIQEVLYAGICHHHVRIGRVDTGLHESEAPGAYRKVLGVYIARPDKYLQYDNSQIVHR